MGAWEMGTMALTDAQRYLVASVECAVCEFDMYRADYIAGPPGRQRWDCRVCDSWVSITDTGDVFASCWTEPIRLHQRGKDDLNVQSGPERAPTLREWLERESPFRTVPIPRATQQESRPVARPQRRSRELLPPDFWTMGDQNQLHALAVAIVASENFRALRELLVHARLEIRTAQPVKPALTALRQRCAREGGRLST
jgi:hypothetical protein